MTSGSDKSDTVRRGPGNFDRDFGPGHVAYLRDKLDRVGAERDEARAEVERLREALRKIKATCDGQVAEEPRRASYAGISNFIRRELREGDGETTGDPDA